MNKMPVLFHILLNLIGKTDRQTSIRNQFRVKVLPVSMTQLIEYVAFYKNFNELTMEFV